MAGAMGDNYLVQVGATSSSPASYTTVGCQGDLTLNTGKSLEVSRTKNCKHPFFREAGYTATFTIEGETPMHATHTTILDAADNETLLDVKVLTTDSGMPIWEGEAYVAYEPMTAPTEGPVTFQILVAWVNDPTRSAAA